MEAAVKDDDVGGGAELAIEARLDASGAPVLALGGELDSSNADTLEAAVQSVTAKQPELVIFDMSELRFMDSAGIAVLVAAAAAVPRVTLRRPADVVRRVIELTGLAEVLVIER